MKKDCEAYLRATYPNWSQQNQIGAGSANFNMLAELGASDTWRPPPKDTTDSHGLQALINSIKLQHNINSDFGTSPATAQFQSNPSRPAENEFIKKMIPSSPNVPSSPTKQQPQTPLQPTSAGPASSTNFMNDHGMHNHSYNVLGAMAATGDNLIKEYEREIKRQDTNNLNNTMFNNTGSSVTFGADVIIDAVGPAAGPAASAPAIPRSALENQNWTSSPKTNQSSDNINATKVLIQRLSSDAPSSNDNQVE